LATTLAKAFTARYPDVKIDVEGGSSSLGVESVGEGRTDVGMISRAVEPSEREAYPDLEVHTIAWRAVLAIVHPQVPVGQLTTDQLRGILAGEIANWREVGGPDRPITVFNREEGSVSRSIIVTTVMGDTPLAGDDPSAHPSGDAGHRLYERVLRTPNSISYIPLGFEGEAKVLAIDGVWPSAATIASGDYPIVYPLSLVTAGEPEGVVKAWLDFILSEEGQAIVTEARFVPPSASFPLTTMATPGPPVVSATACPPSVTPSAAKTVQLDAFPPLPAPSPALPGEPATIPAPGGILYRYDGKLWLTRSDGTLTLVTSHPYARISPDRQMVLHGDKCDDFWIIDQVDRQADTVTRALDVPSLCPRWAPDSRHIYYSKPCEEFYSDSREGYCEWDIWVADIETGERRNLTDTPDRDEECVIHFDARLNTLFFYSTPVEVLTDGGGAGWIGYLTGMQADGTQYTVISEESLQSPASFSPDGTAIAYVSHQLYLHFHSSGSQLVEWERYGWPGKVYVSSTSWSPEGDRLACWATGNYEETYIEGVFVLNLETGTSHVLHPLRHPIYFDGNPPAPDWSPDGRWLAFWGADQGDNAFGTWIVSSDGREVRTVEFLSATDAWDPGGRAWSPDGQWLAFTRHESDPETGIWLVKVGTWELFQTDLPVDAIVVDWVGDSP
jgi:phosphate transport system substrate-binding protein